jgi:hypothetical protein
MAVENKCSLNNMLQAVLSANNVEQNSLYPANIYSAHYNSVTSYLLSTIAEHWQENQRFVDIVRPFLLKKVVPNKDGYVVIPEDCRNFLDAAIFVNKNMTGECNDLPQNILEVEFKNAVNKGKCLSRPLEIVDQSEWDALTVHPYLMPTVKNPIGCFFDSNKIKVCPYEINNVEIRYFKFEKVVRYGYTMQPDDTYVFDASTTIESEWNSAAFNPIFKGITALLGMYTRDKEIRDWTIELKQIGLL